MTKVGSLFSGIGGIDIGLQWAGMEIAWQVEIDPFCRKVLEKHWPNVPKYGDIREIRGDELEPVDLVCGGFPCQPFSVAGKRGGTEDDRYLWPEMLRVISELRPSWVLGENVTGIVNMALDTVLSDLEAEGYETGAFIIPACAVGAPHRRDRVWIVAHSAGVECRPRAKEQRVLRGMPTDGEECDNASGSGEAQSGKDVAHAKSKQNRRLQPSGLLADIGANRKDVADTNGTGCKKCDTPIIAEGPGHCSWSTYSQWREWPAQSGLGGMFNRLFSWLDGYRWPAPYGCEQYEWEPPRITSGVPNRVNRLKALGNAVVPKIPEIIGLAIMQIEEGMKA